MTNKETFVGSCSKFVDGQGWITEIPIKQLNEKGYYKVDYEEIKAAIKREIAQTFAMAEYVDGKAGFKLAVEAFIKENIGNR